MRVFLDAPTCLPIWLSPESNHLLENGLARLSSLSSAAASADEMQNIQFPNFATPTTEKPCIIVPNDRMRTAMKSFSYHVTHCSLPVGSFVQYDSHVALASPELCFLRLANRLSLATLVKLGCVLCSSFAYGEEKDLVFRRTPATTPQKLAEYIDQSSNIQGVKKARRALKWIVQGAASPAEIDVMLLLCLPVMMGGYGLPLPEMNAHIYLDTETTNMLGYSDCYCDLFWRKARLDLEYNSDLHHSSPEEHTRDEIRRTALENAGVKVVFLTKAQMYNPSTFDGVAKIISKELGHRVRKPDQQQNMSRFELRKELLYSSSQYLQPIRR